LTGTADIRQGELVAALLDASASRADVKVKRLEEYLRDRAGILAAHGVGMYQFPHRSFQEYLAACHLTDDDFPDQMASLARRDPNRWREVALLAGAKAARGSTLNAWALSESLCYAPPARGRRPGGRPLGRAAGGAGVGRVRRSRQGRTAQRHKLRGCGKGSARSCGATLPATERALAGRTLAALGDPRPEVTSLYGMHFCCVPPGPFVMGSREENSVPGYEKPQHTVDLGYPYFMARFPVTVAQWREYVQLSGHSTGDEDRIVCGGATTIRW